MNIFEECVKKYVIIVYTESTPKMPLFVFLFLQRCLAELTFRVKKKLYHCIPQLFSRPTSSRKLKRQLCFNPSKDYEYIVQCTQYISFPSSSGTLTSIQRLLSLHSDKFNWRQHSLSQQLILLFNLILSFKDFEPNTHSGPDTPRKRRFPKLRE